jgi:hypothetical protein
MLAGKIRLDFFGLNTECKYLRTQGIGNNVVLDNILFTGKNNGMALQELFIVSLPQNVSFTNLKFNDFIWPGDSYGKILMNFVETSCPDKS